MITREHIIQLFEKAEVPVDGSTLDDRLPLAQQGLDSLDMANLLFHIEQTHEFRISPEEASRLRTIQDMVDCINARAHANEAAAT